MPTYNSIGAYRFLVCSFVYSFVHPASLCEFNSSEVINPMAFIFGRIIGHDM